MNGSLTPDQVAAHEFLTELRTRISTQPLPYQYGVEVKALESLWQVFVQARAAMKNNPGCKQFAHLVTTMLNVHLRPVTAKWDRAFTEGRLNSRDGANEFRADLEKVQQTLRKFAIQLQEMAYGPNQDPPDERSPEVLKEKQLDDWFGDLPFGIANEGAVTIDNVDKINEQESAAIKKRRDYFKVTTNDGMNAVGLGLSGGGIRSATFCLGVVQVLTAYDLLKDVDFLSTVSGGGYVGCFLTSRLGNKQPHSDVGNPHGPDTPPIRHLRQHAKYLAASNLKEQWSMVTSTFAGMVLNWTAPIFLIAAVTWIAIGVEDRWSPLPWPQIMVVSIGLTLLALIVYSLFLRLTPNNAGGWILGTATALTLVLGFCWGLGRAYDFLINHMTPSWKWGTTGVLATAVTAFPAIVRFIPILRAPSIRKTALKSVLLVAGLIVPLGAIALSFLFFYFGTSELDHINGVALLALITIFCGLISIFVLNVNLTSPHRLYRNQLAKTFIETPGNAAQASAKKGHAGSNNIAAGGIAAPSRSNNSQSDAKKIKPTSSTTTALQETDSTPVPLIQINPAGTAPYHLINATVNLPSSTDKALRERRSDFFLFSKYWCGAPSISYVPTSEWRTDRAPIDIATAMAVSGAAVSPYMGLESMPTLTALLAFLNVRLGFWILRPKKTSLAKVPGFLCLLREMTGIAMSEKEAWINLSDGGHIENMGVYELLRRRCKYIISVDGEADPQSTFHGHLTLVRHAMIDFGIRIEPDLNSLRPDVDTRFSQTHFMLCRVLYPDVGDKPGGYGLILYMKLSVTGNEIELIKRYRKLHPDFPHESTLDQFFDEEQFEAYRQLGVHVAEGLFSPALINTDKRPATIDQWFRRLAKNLLEPGAA